MRIGIIPARAGFTEQLVHDGQYRGDHPRSRGVYLAVTVGTATIAGSSPLARGLLLPSLRAIGEVRIIPARAGFTRSRRRADPGPQDHPRSRGVYLLAHPAPSQADGSSPLARGLRKPAWGYGKWGRIIPARAGFTPEGVSSKRLPGDHPRSRGVYKSKRWGAPTNLGSSPLARGLLMVLVPLGRRFRIIPARAGFTLAGHVGGTRHRDHPRSRGVYSSARPA